MKQTKTDWSSKKLRGASASEIPENLQALQSKSKTQRTAAANWFEEVLLDDDDHYPPVTTDVVSALLEMLQNDEVSDRALSN